MGNDILTSATVTPDKRQQNYGHWIKASIMASASRSFFKVSLKTTTSHFMESACYSKCNTLLKVTPSNSLLIFCRWFTNTSEVSVWTINIWGILDPVIFVHSRSSVTASLLSHRSCITSCWTTHLAVLTTDLWVGPSRRGRWDWNT